MKKPFIFLFLFFLLVVPFVTSAEVDQITIISNSFLEYFEVRDAYDLDSYFSDADSYCVGLNYKGYEFYECLDRNNSNTNVMIWFWGEFNISLQYEPHPTQYGIQDCMVNSTNCFNMLSVWHNFDPAINNNFSSYSFAPVVIDAWDLDGNMVGQYISIAGDNQTHNWSHVNAVPYYPALLKQFSDINLGHDTQQYYSIEDYFVNYDYLTLNWYDATTGASGSFSKTPTSEETGMFCQGTPSYGPSRLSVEICLESLGDDLMMSLHPTGFDANVTIDLYAHNTYGFAFDSFNVLTSDIDSPYQYDTPQNDSLDEMTSSFVGSLSSVFLNLYPLHTTLSTRMKFAYILITLLIINLSILSFFFKFGQIQNASYLLLILNVVALFYFLAIAYIPVSVLVITSLIVISLTMFKLRAGG